MNSPGGCLIEHDDESGANVKPNLWSTEGLFHDRADAGRDLAERLGSYRGRETVVLGIPRGGVAVAAEVARLLDARLDVIVARKIGAPGQQELALGAVTADGGRVLNQEIIDLLPISETYLDAATQVQVTEARRREARYRGLYPAIPLEGRTVLVVDDGLATGASMLASVRAVRGKHPRRLVAAVPVGSAQACELLRKEVDDLVCPLRPEPFGAVGLYYERFAQVEDEEVEEMLAHARATVTPEPDVPLVPSAK
jgi:predicted phosphoribosyltransferase